MGPQAVQGPAVRKDPHILPHGTADLHEHQLVRWTPFCTDMLTLHHKWIVGQKVMGSQTCLVRSIFPGWLLASSLQSQRTLGEKKSYIRPFSLLVREWLYHLEIYFIIVSPGQEMSPSTVQSTLFISDRDLLWTCPNKNSPIVSPTLISTVTVKYMLIPGHRYVASDLIGQCQFMECTIVFKEAHGSEEELEFGFQNWGALDHLVLGIHNYCLLYKFLHYLFQSIISFDSAIRILVLIQRVDTPQQVFPLGTHEARSGDRTRRYRRAAAWQHRADRHFVHTDEG